MNGLTYSAANLARLVRRPCSRSRDHVQTAHSPIATGMSHCMGDSCYHAGRAGCLFRAGNTFETHGRGTIASLYSSSAEARNVRALARAEVARATLSRGRLIVRYSVDHDCMVLPLTQ